MRIGTTCCTNLTAITNLLFLELVTIIVAVCLVLKDKVGILLVVAIAVVDITKAFRAIGDANYEYIIPYIMLALVYLVLVLIITLGIKLMERRLKRNERNN